jgi:ADP-ribosylation factor family
VFWDLGGQRGLRRIWEKYYAESHAVMCVVDAADPGRLEEVKVTLEQMLADEQLLGAPLLVAANKKACIGCHFNWGTCISPKVSPARLSIQVCMVITGSPLTVPRKARHRQLHCLSVCPKEGTTSTAAHRIRSRQQVLRRRGLALLCMGSLICHLPRGGGGGLR